MCHDINWYDPWWSSWNANQRDIYFFYKEGEGDEASWKYYCHFSMNDRGVSEVRGVVLQMLSLVEESKDPSFANDDEDPTSSSAGESSSSSLSSSMLSSWTINNSIFLLRTTIMCVLSLLLS